MDGILAAEARRRAQGVALFDERRDHRGRILFERFHVDPPVGDVDAALEALTRLYVIACGDFRKIGLARKPRRRLATLQLANPHRITLERSVAVPEIGARYAESWAHAKLAHAHERGEWFAVADTLAAQVITGAARRGFAFRRHAAAILLP